MRLSPMDLKTRRLLTFIISGGYLFLGGCEYAVIFPTAWDYLQSLGVTNEFWLGLTVSVYSFSAAIAGVIGGHLADKYKAQTKNIAIIATFLRIIGSLQYTLGFSVWNIFAARLVCGCGTVAGSVMLAEVCRITTLEERTPILTVFNAARQMGILVGPGFQMLLSLVTFRIGTWLEINPLNSPGVFMAILWVIFGTGIVFMFYNIADELKDLTHDQRMSLFKEMSSKKPEPNTTEEYERRDSLLNGRSRTYGAIERSHTAVISQSMANGDRHNKRRRHKRRRSSSAPPFQRNSQNSMYRSMDGYIDNLLHASSLTQPSEKRNIMSEFLNDSFVTLFSMVFTTFFCQIGVETIIPVVMENYFGYGDFENSLVYMLGGLEALLVYFVVALGSRRFRDTKVLSVGWALMLAGQIWLLVVIPMFENGETTSLHMIYFLAGVVVLYIGYPIASSANMGLYSKYLSDESQGIGQGLRRLSSYVGLIIGPAWAGSTIRHPYIFLGVSVSIMALNAVMFALSFKDIKKLDNPSESEANSSDEDEESRILLSD